MSFLYISYLITAAYSIVVSIALLVIMRRKKRRVFKQETPYFFKRENGMSLVEVMVAAGIMGGLSLVVAQMMQNQNEVMTHAEAKNEEMELINQIRITLSSKAACEATFQGSGLDTTVDEIRNSSGNVVFETGGVYGNRALQLNQLTISNQNVPASGGVGEAVLSVEMERLKKNNGQTIMEKDLMVQVSTDSGGVIDECYSDSSNSIETAKEEMCESINGVYDSATDQCDLSCISSPGESHEAVSSECLDGVRADERTISENSYVNVSGDTMTGPLEVQADLTAQKLLANNQVCLGGNCRTTFADQNCPVGQVVSRVRTNGVIECANVTCPSSAEFYVGIDTNGDVLCKPFPTETCPADHYVKKVYDDGSVDCGQVPESEKISGQDCSTGEIVSGIDSNGNLKCAPHVLNDACPLGEYVRGYNGLGEPICVADKDVWDQVCPAGQYVRGYDASGNPNCVADAHSAGQTCPSGEVVKGIDSDGSLVCEPSAGGEDCSAGPTGHYVFEYPALEHMEVYGAVKRGACSTGGRARQLVQCQDGSIYFSGIIVKNCRPDGSSR